MKRRWLAILSASVIACSDDALPLDAGPDGDVDGGAPTVDVTPPEPPAPPQMACPDGWREVVVGDDPTTCTPWPEGGRVECPPGEFHPPGATGCAPVGSPCPTDAFPDVMGDVIYVDAGARGGDGSRVAPFATIEEASSLATAGSVIALAAGTYEEQVAVGSGVSLRGACAARTIIRSTSSPVVRLTGAASEVRDLTVEALSEIAVEIAPGSESALDGTVVRGATLHAIVVDDATMDARDLHVSASGSSIMDYAIGVDGASGRATLGRVVVDGGAGPALQVGEAAEVAATDFVAHEARGVVARGRLTIDRCVLSDNRRQGAEALGGDVRLSHCVISGTLPDERMNGGVGAYASSGGAMEVQQSVIESVHRSGARLRGSGGALTLSDVVIRDTSPQPSNGEGGFGVELQGDLAGGTAPISLSRVAVLRSHNAGIFAVIAGELDARDIRVADVTSRDGFGVGGHGISIEVVPRATLARVLIERTQETGFGARQVSDLTLEDLEVRTGSGREVDGRFGDGLVLAGVRGQLQRILVHDMPRIGMWVGDRSVVNGNDVRIRRTRAQDCADAGCTDSPFGMGLGTYQLAAMSLTAFHIEDSSLCGLQVAIDGELDLRDGIVSGSSIGACIQVAGYDLRRLSDNVAYVDNDLNLVASTLPTPSVADTVVSAGD